MNRSVVHRHQVDVDIDDEVALAGPPVEPEVLTVPGLAETHQAVLFLGVMAVIAIGIVGLVDVLPHHAPHLPLRHLPMESLSCSRLPSLLLQQQRQEHCDRQQSR